MSRRKVLLYFAWSRPSEVQAPLDVISDRFPAVFELRRMLYPRLEALADAERFDQGIAGFLDNVQRFLAHPDHLVCVCVHHDIGETGASTPTEHLAGQAAAFYHHGDRTIPPRQGFGGFARALLAGLGMPVINRYGLKPAAQFDGTPQPIEVDEAVDRLGLLDGVETFNLHPHLPHLERVDAGLEALDVLARQHIDLAAPPHPFVQSGHETFDALLQSRADVFPGTLLVSDATLWSSTAGGVASLRRLWSNVVSRGRR